MTRDELTKEQRAELEALAEFNDCLKGPSFMSRLNWPEYRTLVRRGLVTWGDPPAGFTKKRFAGTEITDKGRLAIRARAGARS